MSDGRVTGESAPSASETVTTDDVAGAHEHPDGVVHRMLLDSSRAITGHCEAGRVDPKLESVQRTGSSKIRGAYNAMAQLPESVRERGVVASNADNHAQGVAPAGDLLDVDTTIVAPEVTPTVKIDATRGYGMDVVVEGELYEKSYEHTPRLAEDEGLEFVHPFDDATVIAGQGAVGREIAANAPGADAVLVSIGGGGFISGIATAIQARDPEVRVIDVRPEGTAHAKPSLEAGKIRMLSAVDTVAEGIADARLLERTFAVVRDRVDDVVSVDDTDLAVATMVLAQWAKTVTEPAGAAPVVALLSGAADVEDERVAAVVSGGNVDLFEHTELTRVGMQAPGRAVEARLEFDGWPVTLGDLSEAVVASGAELDSVECVARIVSDIPNRVPVEIRLDGSGPDRLADALDSLSALDGVEIASHSLDERGESTESS